MRKTIKEWFNELPEGYRERAIKNTHEGRMNTHEPTMVEVIYRSFRWSGTPEGHTFWREVKDHYAKGTLLPPLPNQTGHQVLMSTINKDNLLIRLIRESDGTITSDITMIDRIQPDDLNIDAEFSDMSEADAIKTFKNLYNL
jgi:hypothetical protein